MAKEVYGTHEQFSAMVTGTPGPWITHDRNIWAGEVLLAKVYKQGDQGEANARLMAAAPALLQLAQNVVAYSHALPADPLMQELVGLARAAIREAKGEHAPLPDPR